MEAWHADCSIIAASSAPVAGNASCFCSWVSLTGLFADAAANCSVSPVQQGDGCVRQAVVCEAPELPACLHQTLLCPLCLQSYYNCGNQPSYRPCGAGTVFNDAQQYCDW